MTRRELREQTFKLLFRAEFYDSLEMKEQTELFAEEMDQASEEDVNYVCDRVDGVIAHKEEIDAAIDTVAKGWKTNRMAKVELTILRLAYYEMKMDEDIPVSVAVNEAVELAKKFGQDDAPSFVNAILAKLV